MKTVLIIREKPNTKCGGIDTNCQALVDAFKDDLDIRVFPILNLNNHNIKALKTRYIKKKDIENLIIQYNPDIVHIHGASTFTIYFATKVALKYGKKIVLSPHFHPFNTLKRPILGKSFFYLVVKPLLKIYSAIFTINNDDTNLFKKYNPNVIKLPHWSRYNIIQEESIVKKKRMILFVGRANDINKGIEHIYCIPEGKFEIHIVGKGDIKFRSDIIQHINISDDELKKLYSEASLLVVPSHYEAFSYVALEALYNFTPIVISNGVKIGDYLKKLSFVGIFKYQDYNDFNETIDKVIGKRVFLDAIIPIFDPVIIKEKYKEIYNSI